ncbi:MAG: response regulator transcription factor [Pirellulaceae bacterium]|nr:response regulator transcription factor [Pirellulaceae bacterium]
MSLKILVAEDDTHTRAALAEVLRSDGHQVTEAADGQQAKFLFDNQPPDLACLDVMMPGLSGYDLCRHFRQTQPRMPILFITAKAEEIDKVVGLELGADDYIVKPFGAKEVLARIRAVARRSISGFGCEEESPRLPQHDFWMNDLEVLPRQLRARRDEHAIELTPRELRILQLLASKPGEVVDRHELFRVGWEENHIPNSRTLDQTISQLRKRIEHDPKNPRIIQTVYGAGYRYEQDAECANG